MNANDGFNDFDSDGDDNDNNKDDDKPPVNEKDGRVFHVGGESRGRWA